MIPILFNETATDFTTFGIGVLRECTSCEVTEERNGSFELTLKYPTSGDLFSYLKNERIIVVKPNTMAGLPGIDYRCVITYKDSSTGLEITHPLTISFSRVVNGGGIVDLLVTTPLPTMSSLETEVY